MSRLEIIDEFLSDIKTDYKIHKEKGIYVFDVMNGKFKITSTNLEDLLIVVIKNLVNIAKNINEI